MIVGDIVQILVYPAITLGRVVDISKYSSKYWSWSIPPQFVKYDFIKRCWIIDEFYVVKILGDTEKIELDHTKIEIASPQLIVKWRKTFTQN